MYHHFHAIQLFYHVLPLIHALVVVWKCLLLYSLLISSAVFFLVVVDIIFRVDCVRLYFSVEVGNIDYFAYVGSSKCLINNSGRGKKTFSSSN